MKGILKNILASSALLFAMGSTSSCTDYLDKTPDSDVSAEEAFKNFNNFQGFVEEMYNCIPHKETMYWNTTFNWGEDEMYNSNSNYHVAKVMDDGNFRAYFTCWGGNLSYLYGTNTKHSSTDRFDHHIWNDAFYCIRKCNLGIENINLLTEANQEQKDAVLGQLYFFRAWWHEELMIYFGGIPYIDKVLNGGEKLTLPRPTFQECAKLAAQDFAKAAELLPNDWDKSAAGAATKGANELRITKSTALAYQGKMLLWAASPLAENGAQTGGHNTFKYNTELAAQAAEALGSVISLIESGQTPYALAEYLYGDASDPTENKPNDLFNHTKAQGSTTNYSDIFYTVSDGWRQPGTCEAMLRGTPFGINDARWGFATVWGPQDNSLCYGSEIRMPTANYVDYAYGTKDGYLIMDEKGNYTEHFDPKHPFKDRDNRFYHDIVFDGEKFITAGNDGTYKDLVYCTLYSGGIMRDNVKGSMTGYFTQKLVPHQYNQVDDWGGYGKAFSCYLPYMRVADVYLMYAEAGSAASGCQSSTYKASTCDKTAADAINVLHKRAGVADIPGEYLSGEAFMNYVRHERACELAFEGFRFNDLQRWLLLTEKPYTLKKAVQFKRVSSTEDVQKNPAEAEVADYNTNDVILERNYGTKHYWFPFKDSEVYLYGDFPQNPGW